MTFGNQFPHGSVDKTPPPLAYLEPFHKLAEQLPSISESPYAELKRVFDQAFKSQTEGKSRQRHNKSGAIPFERQRIMQISETIGSPHGLSYQVTKKMLEALDMAEVEKAIHELEGAMVYLGALILYVERNGTTTKPINANKHNKES